MGSSTTRTEPLALRRTRNKLKILKARVSIISTSQYPSKSGKAIFQAIRTRTKRARRKSLIRK